MNEEKKKWQNFNGKLRILNYITKRKTKNLRMFAEIEWKLKWTTKCWKPAFIFLFIWFVFIVFSKKKKKYKETETHFGLNVYFILFIRQKKKKKKIIKRTSTRCTFYSQVGNWCGISVCFFIQSWSSKHEARAKIVQSIASRLLCKKKTACEIEFNALYRFKPLVTVWRSRVDISNALNLMQQNIQL